MSPRRRRRPSTSTSRRMPRSSMVSTGISGSGTARRRRTAGARREARLPTRSPGRSRVRAVQAAASRRAGSPRPRCACRGGRRWAAGHLRQLQCRLVEDGQHVRLPRRRAARPGRRRRRPRASPAVDPVAPSKSSLEYGHMRSRPACIRAVALGGAVAEPQRPSAWRGRGGRSTSLTRLGGDGGERRVRASRAAAVQLELVGREHAAAGPWSRRSRRCGARPAARW